MAFGDPPADELVHTAYARETGDVAILYKGMSLADLAHVVGLVESKTIPREAGGELLSALLDIHPSPPLDFAVDPARGDVYSNRESYLKMLTPTVGWLSTGRARREATTIGYRIAVRDRLLTLASALGDWVKAALDQAEAHRTTLFPDFTYLQPAQPTVFGHYLLTFVYPALRDLDRLRAAFERTNASPAGSGSVNGSRLPLDRASLAKLLGFETIIPHTRDAMWQADGPIEVAAGVTAILVNLDRLAEDLQIFSTAEFGLVELADRHTRTSVIMPQKKNPYSLAYLRGLAGESIGTLAAMAAVGKTPSGQIDNRMFAYGDVPRAVNRAIGAALLMADVTRGLTVRVEVSTKRASENFLGATDLAEIITVQCGVDYRSAHDLVARAVHTALGAGVETLTTSSIDRAAEATIGRKLELAPEVITEALDPVRIVATRTGPGGAAGESVTQMIAECRGRLTECHNWCETARSHLTQAESRLMIKAAALRIADRARPAAPSPPEGEPSADAKKAQSWEELFDDLPRLPNWRRRHFPHE
jgi:argininosuccinate lyase